MNNYIAPGDSVTVVMPYARTSGEGVLVGALFGAAIATYASGATGQMQVTGIVTSLVKASGTGEGWTPGDKLYWNDTNKNLVKASGTGNTADWVGISLDTVGTAVTTAGAVRLRA